ncbi:MAG: iron-sulfur cluster assembly accessory protein [Planctomycetes bacterium]|nr:iron-sulfur cluster assembly accessory protein [Planctomycetota bacterium]
MGISLSEGAVREVNTILSQQLERLKGEAKEGETNVEELFLRVGVKGGGCSGFNYTLDLTDQTSSEDEVFEHDGIKIVCDPRSYLYLNGVAIDFRDEMMGRGFVFTNPNATSTCGCGSSFTP